MRHFTGCVAHPYQAHRKPWSAFRSPRRAELRLATPRHSVLSFSPQPYLTLPPRTPPLSVHSRTLPERS